LNSFLFLFHLHLLPQTLSSTILFSATQHQHNNKTNNNTSSTTTQQIPLYLSHSPLSFVALSPFIFLVIFHLKQRCSLSLLVTTNLKVLAPLRVVKHAFNLDTEASTQFS